ncbi:Jag N-terminal domain-containing protein [Campylobacterota bacterium]
MVKIEAETLESAYSQAAEKLSCSITQLNIEVIQTPKNGFLGMFKKQAIIVATSKIIEEVPKAIEKTEEKKTDQGLTRGEDKASVNNDEQLQSQQKRDNKKVKPKQQKKAKQEVSSHSGLILPESFVTDQEDDYDGSDIYADEEDEIYVGEETEICDKSHDEIHEQLAGSSRASSHSQSIDNFFEECCKPSEVASEIKENIDRLFKHACFEIDEIKVCEHDDKTILVEFTGKDAALLIGKEGYRYKALSYMLYNWINAKYQLQLRLEIAEFLKNQEEMICKYLEGVNENIDRDGRAQTKILDGVLVQIALRELRASYPDKYVAIRSTRDGAKFIIVNSFNNSNTNNY